MANWLYFKEENLPNPVELPESYREVVLKKPFGKGSYRLRCNILKKSKQTTLVEAYSRLIRVGGKDGIYWMNINVEPYKRRIPTYYIESESRFI